MLLCRKVQLYFGFGMQCIDNYQLGEYVIDIWYGMLCAANTLLGSLGMCTPVACVFRGRVPHWTLVFEGMGYLDDDDDDDEQQQQQQQLL